MTLLAILMTLAPGQLPLATHAFAELQIRDHGAAAAVQESTAVVAETRRFQLRSDPRVALHHFLVAWAAADAGEWPRFAVPVEERGYWHALLDDAEERAWTAAVDAYAVTVGRSVTFDDDLIAVRDWAAGVGTRESIAATDQVLADAIEAALPLYLRHWWPAHDARSRAWIASLASTLAAIEEDMVPRLEAAYGGRWPDEQIPIDVVVYANPVGAYSTGGRVTIDGGDYGNSMPQALEMVFHEASHIGPLGRALRAAVEGGFRAAGGTAPQRFWHDMIFYTTGEVTRLVLARHGQPGYRHYGEFGVYRRGERWEAQLPALEAHWRPFLESASADASARRAALEALASQLLSEGPGSR